MYQCYSIVCVYPVVSYIVLISGLYRYLYQVSRAALEKRHAQGWLQEFTESLPDLVARVRRCRKVGQQILIKYLQ